MKKMNCPICGKELIRLEPYEDKDFKFWCDNCDIDIAVHYNTRTETEISLDNFVKVGETIKISGKNPYTIYGAGEWKMIEESTNFLGIPAIVWERIK